MRSGRGCTPARIGQHWPLFSVCLLAASGLLFAFMAGHYPAWAAAEAARAAGCEGAAGELAVRCWRSAVLQLPAATGPAFLRDVLLAAPPRQAAATATSPSTAAAGLSFSSAYLRLWGGRTAAELHAGQAYRWLTAPLLHTDVRHLAANLALFAALGCQMEVKYGTVRLLAVWLLAAVGGELLSVAAEDPCRQVVGLSGGDFGLLGLFCADALLNFKTVRRPILRCTAIAILLGFLIYTLAVHQGSVSAMTHLGGLLCGLLPSLLVLPRLASERAEAAWPALGGAAVLTWFTVLPAWVYRVRLPAAAEACGAAAEAGAGGSA
ncbi:hypothetical protein GPECTOR_1g855 [Gonium pectorale]|uniref:RHOMBOID-like protein n=1 Tax=Gonium pectorale TaxID=33097 RepID=A0A150H528_GONPE|nr:hypothetical protein GPECTOR_1g855 [Gonium pectorale]|eukprot:KXZ56948.1 hypothetical protein GPECTOR_1g855 [Gonium pectorale]